MKDLNVFNFNSDTVRVISDEDGAPLFLARDVAGILGYQNPSKAYQDHCKYLKKFDYNELLESNFSRPHPKGEYFILEKDVYRLIMKSNAQNAEAFQDWVCDEVLPTIRKIGAYSKTGAEDYVLPLPPTIPQLQIAESFIRVCRMSDTSKIRMYTSICEDLGVSSKFLPAYSEEAVTLSLTELLKRHNSQLSAKAANIILHSIGVLEKLTRPSTGGTVKEFWSITDAFLKYGKNETSPQNPRETQPLWYVETFSELMDLISSI